MAKLLLTIASVVVIAVSIWAIEYFIFRIIMRYRAWGEKPESDELDDDELDEVPRR